MKRLGLAAIFLAAVFCATWSALALSPVPQLLFQQSQQQTHDGISLNFSKSIENGGCCYVKAPGQPARRGKFTDLFTFTRASTATFLGGNGLIQTAGTNVPRIEYDASGNLLGLLIEGARTNLALWSEDASNAVWVNTNITVAANSAIAPDGNTTADTLTASAVNGTQSQSFQPSTTNAVRTYSRYLKRLTGAGNVTLEVGRTASSACTLSSSAWNRCSVTDTVLTGTYAVVSNVVTVTATAHGLLTGDAVRLDYTSGTAADLSCASVTRLDANSYTCAQTTGDTTGNVSTYANLGRIKIATDTDAVYAWCGDGEVGAFASSCIPTTTVTVARAGDVATRTLAAEFNATAGSMFVQFQTVQTLDVAALASIDDNGTSNAINFVISQTVSQAALSVRSGAVQQANVSIIDGTAWNGALVKAAGSWAVNDFDFALRSTLATPDASGTLPAVTLLRMKPTIAFFNEFYGHVRLFDYYSTTAPNSFLQQKTQPGPQSALDWPHFAANDNENDERKAA